MSAANMENARTAASLKEAEQACRSGLPSGSDMPDPFVLLDSITHWDAQGLEAETHLNGAWWEALEAAAQACAYHQRWRTNFGDHAFLLSLDRVGF
ncbi:MAG: hypothetical protein Q4F72_06990, partial [Desulfovibrionaceae bacterium]|nr:hypothetical protein [Desulfovibrionaceae bacterium]